MDVAEASILSPRLDEALTTSVDMWVTQYGKDATESQKMLAYARKQLHAQELTCSDMLREQSAERWAGTQLPSRLLNDLSAALASAKPAQWSPSAREQLSQPSASSVAPISTGTMRAGVSIVEPLRAGSTNDFIDSAPLELAPAAFGTKGEKILLRANHFVLSGVGANQPFGSWLCWQVIFPDTGEAIVSYPHGCVTTPAQDVQLRWRGAAGHEKAEVISVSDGGPAAHAGVCRGHRLISTGGGYDGGHANFAGLRPPTQLAFRASVFGRSLRQAVVRARMAELRVGDDKWMYDGNARLWTAEAVGLLVEGAALVMPAPRGLERPASAEQSSALQRRIKVTVVQARDAGSCAQQRLRLDKLLQPHAGGLEGDVGEERRFVHVLLRRHAEVNGLVVRGRRVICPAPELRHELQLPRDISDAPLRHARELWFGYFSSVELIDGPNGPRCSLNLNLVATVGLCRMSVVRLIARLLAEKCNKKDWVDWFETKMTVGEWPDELDQDMLRILDSDVGLKGLRVCSEHMGYPRNYKVVGITWQDANSLHFHYKDKNYDGDVSVAYYFQWRYGKYLTGQLPCLMLGNSRNWVPIELLTVLGGEHNLMVGKLRSDYQADVTRRTAMEPRVRQRAIEALSQSFKIGPKKGLRDKGLEISCDMLSLEGRLLPAPSLSHGNSSVITPNHYADNFAAAAPPDYEVAWGIWSYVGDDHSDLNSFATQLWNTAKRKQVFLKWPPSFVERKNMWLHEDEAPLRKDLGDVSALHCPEPPGPDSLRLLVVLLPGNKAKAVYNALKTITETELGTFQTQCVDCRNGVLKVTQKLNNLVLKIIEKLPRSANGHGCGAHPVELWNPHPLLKSAKTVVIGADVTHDALGVSIAGVVASGDASFTTYFSELRAQSPFVDHPEQQRTRRSQERVLELDKMVQRALQRRKDSMHGELPETVLYYRDGVSDGQFPEVMKFEFNKLICAFRRLGKHYNPKLVIIVGQKRHHTRLFLDNASADSTDGGITDGGKSSKGDKRYQAGGRGLGHGRWSNGGKGGGGKNASQNVQPGTVAGKGIARPGHLNFFLVAHQGIQGCAVPCHLHVLHLDPRLSQEGIDVDALEQITYEICHVYPRADKTVSYPTPAYLADHLCERGKLYLEQITPLVERDEWAFASVSSFTTSEEEERTRQQVTERVVRLNNLLDGRRGSVLEGLNYFC